MRKKNGLNFDRSRKKVELTTMRQIISWLIEAAVLIIIAYVLTNYLGMQTRMSGNAMEPTLKDQESVLVNTFSYVIGKPDYNDLVVFLPNGNEKSHYYIRRVVGLPGDSIQIRDGLLYVNGEAYEEVIDAEQMENAGIASEKITLGSGEYFVLGDNRNQSEDSRNANIGIVQRTYIVGRAYFAFENLKSFGLLR